MTDLSAPLVWGTSLSAQNASVHFTDAINSRAQAAEVDATAARFSGGELRAVSLPLRFAVVQYLAAGNVGNASRHTFTKRCHACLT